MNARRAALTLTVAGLGMLTSTVPVRADDGVRLEWRHVQGDRYEWRQESTLELSLDVKTRLRSSTETTRRTQALRGRVEVLAVDDAGTASLRIRVTEFRLDQTGPYALTLAAHHRPESPSDRHAEVVGDEVPTFEQENVERTLQALADRMIYATFECRVTPTGEVSHARVRGRLFDTQARDPVVRGVLLQTLGATSNSQFANALGRALVTDLPGGTCSDGSTWQSGGPLDVGFHSIPVTRDARLTATAPTAQVALVLGTEAAGSALVDAYCGAASTDDRYTWDVVDSTTTSGELRGELQYSAVSGRPVSEHLSGELWRGTASVAERGGVMKRELSLTASLDQKTTWERHPDDAPETSPTAEGPERESEAPPTATDEGGDGELGWSEVEDAEGRLILAWRPAVGTRWRLTREVATEEEMGLKIDRGRFQTQKGRHATGIVSEATVVGPAPSYPGRSLELRILKFTRVHADDFTEVELRVERKPDGTIEADVEVTKDELELLGDGDLRETERKVRRDLLLVFGPLMKSPTQMVLIGTGLSLDVVAPDGAVGPTAKQADRFGLTGLAPAGADADKFAWRLLRSHFVELPGEATDVGGQWRGMASTGEMIAVGGIERVSTLSSRSRKALIRDEVAGGDLRRSASDLLRAMLGVAGSMNMTLTERSAKDRSTPVIGKSVYDPETGVVELRRVGGRVLDSQSTFSAVTEPRFSGDVPSVIVCTLRLRAEYSELLRCEMVDSE